MVMGLQSCFLDMLPGGSCATILLLRRYTLLGFVYSVAMSREGLVSIVLLGLNGDIETRHLWRDTVFFEIFSAYAYRVGYAPATTRFYHLNSVVEWDSALADHGFSDEGRINLVAFGWIFSAADLGYFDQWGEPPPLWRGVYCRIALNAERRRSIGLGYINNRLRVLDDQRVAFVAQLFGANRGDFNRHERHEEVIMTQMEVIRRLLTNVQVVFFLAPR